jgi:hypothetical protein
MDPITGSGFSFQITEWWDLDGEWRDGSPSYVELLEASQYTGELTWIDPDGQVTGSNFYTGFSPDGWEPNELEAEVQDAADAGGSP